MPNHSWESPRAKRAHLAAAHERETQPRSSDTSAIRGTLFSTNQTQVRGSMDPHAAAKPTYQNQYHVLKTKDSTCQPLDESWGRLAAGPGRPTVGRWPSGPHHLKSSMWHSLIGCLSWFLEVHLQMELPLAVAPCWRSFSEISTTNIPSDFRLLGP